MSQLISRDNLENLTESDNTLILIEALPQKYFNAEHLPGAINIPHDEIQTQAAKLIPDRNATVVVYCASNECQNSHTAAEILNQLGYTNVYVYAGGKKDWKEAGLPFEKTGSVL